MNRLTQLLGDPTSFLEQIMDKLATDHIDVASFELDHICYRVETMERYEFLKKELLQLGDLLTESLIGNRPIATFRLRQPIKYQNRVIFLIELPAPKTGSFYPEGYEHVEFVIDQSLERFKASYPKVSFDVKGINKNINPDLRLAYGDSSVKFHLHNLEYVIRYLD